MKKTVTFIALSGHVLFCIYQILLCLYNCSSFVNDIIWKTSETICFAVFEPSVNMIINIAPWWLAGMAVTLILIVIIIRKKSAKYAIPVCVTFAAAIGVFVTIPNEYYFSEYIYDLICWLASFWYLFDIVYVLKTVHSACYPIRK